MTTTHVTVRKVEKISIFSLNFAAVPGIRFMSPMPFSQSPASSKPRARHGENTTSKRAIQNQAGYLLKVHSLKQIISPSCQFPIPPLSYYSEDILGEDAGGAV